MHGHANIHNHQAQVHLKILPFAKELGNIQTLSKCHTEREMKEKKRGKSLSTHNLRDRESKLQMPLD
jgi:hypothetical protein